MIDIQMDRHSGEVILGSQLSSVGDTKINMEAEMRINVMTTVVYVLYILCKILAVLYISDGL